MYGSLPFTRPGKAKKTEIISLDYSYVAREQRNKIVIILLIKELLNLVIQKYCNCYEYIVWINKCRFLTFPPALYHMSFFTAVLLLFSTMLTILSRYQKFFHFLGKLRHLNLPVKNMTSILNYQARNNSFLL